ncbi:SusC/RagA family TonB-linked outer membrane protein [Bacteroidia bacterium]|nr:SusC/RagA family TonB-linked outer membrane protein [Bacteroidia bacterium]GHU81543.1 SusC/RagA family TonB-linked outer membrane protein [Bacteroidia bacterium]GHV70656.1 SusC/RagA family TonB-linked outer membrane protein [Bacteroidia bacterium]
MKMLKMKLALFFMLSFILGIPANGYSENTQQEILVSGVITDSSGEELIGVSISVKGTNAGTSSGIDGKYSIAVPNNAAVLVFSYLGYATQEIPVNGKTSINVVLSEDTQLLDEVVVVGYGTQKKINLTGSVASVDSKKLENRAVTNLSAALGGLAPGIRVTQGRGNPGDESVSIRFRGTTSFNASDPLVLVDGVVADMNVLNTDDIESINFLKDAASAAIYGSRAAAGVILVTTKKGKREKPKVTYSGLFAQEKAETSLKFMSNMPDYMNYHNMAQLNTTGNSTWYGDQVIADWTAANANPNGTYTDPTTGNQIPNWLAYPNTDWAQELFQPTYYHKHGLSVSGGSEVSTYLLSLGYQDNPGTLENTGLQRFNIRANVETKIANFITFGTQTYATKEYKEPGSIEMTYLQQAYPGINPKYKGKFGASEDPNMASMNNVLASVAAEGGQNEYTRINTSWYANVDIWKGISAEAKFNYNEYMREDEHYSQNQPRYRFRLGTGDEAIIDNKPNIDNTTSYRYAYNSKSYTTNLILRYHGVFGKHAIDAFAGQEQYYAASSGFSATKKGLMDWDVTDITAASEVESIGGNAKTDYAMLSYFGRVNYVFNSKYLLEANIRSDASSRFAPGHRGEVFPSFSAGWRVSEENFFEPAKDYVNNLKLRVAYGTLGNTVSGNYDWQEKYNPTKGVFNESIQNGLVLGRLPNYELMWESTSSTDIGIDASFLNNRLSLDASYYLRKTSGILNTPPIYLTLGTVGSAMSNAGDMENHGVDLDLRWNDKIGDDFRYSVGINANYNTNKVTKFKGGLIWGQDESLLDKNGNPTWRYLNLDDVSTGGDTRRVEGRAIDEYFLRKPYHGNGTYTNADGSVNPNGGPKDGMIRTKADLDWARAMVAAGYSFNNKVIGTGSGQIWYGEKLLADLNGDGKYGDSNDREFTGKSSVPKFVFGFNLTAEYKGFDLSAMFAGRLGSYAYIRSRGANSNELTELTDALPANAGNMFYRFNMKESMSNPNYDPFTDPDAYIHAKYPRLYNGTGQMATNTDYLFNTSYLKLKSLQIGYTLPKAWLKGAKINNCRIFVAGENLLTFAAKDFPAVDPELGGSVIVYPIAKLYSCGINLTF